MKNHTKQGLPPQNGGVRISLSTCECYSELQKILVLLEFRTSEKIRCHCIVHKVALVDPWPPVMNAPIGSTWNPSTL